MASAPTALELANMTAEELKAFIESQQPTEVPEGEADDLVVVDPTEGEPTEQPRDPITGKFIKAEEPSTEEFEEIVEKEIDLGDGSGVQLFRGVGNGATQEVALIAAYEDLSEELAKAQRNATAKIRELARQPKQEPEPKAPVFNPEEEARLSQRLISEPSKVLAEISEKAAREAEARLRQQQEARAKEEADANDAAIAFVQATPDYFPCPENQERIGRYMDLYKLPRTVEGISQAFAAVKDILKTKPAAPPAAPQPEAPRPRGSGLSVRRNAAPPAAPTGFDEKGYQAWLESQGLSNPAPIRRKF